ncbi:MAG: histidinol-phosphate aminotransferase family protein [Acidimicrobiia bacterium]|nr:histidinol-phosphate aminotransferase family protein [Acidimicrobiia bacterium]
MSVPRYKWQPTTAEIAAAAGIDPSEVVRFDHNTTPWPTEWTVELAAAAARNLNEYPGASYFGLRRAAAARHGLEPEQIVPGAGADELILLAARAFLGPSKRAVTMAPTYPLYNIACAQVGTQLRNVDAQPPDFVPPVAELIDAARDADLVWLCVPNNPTATEIARTDVDAIIAATDGIVIIDAAYAEFTGDDWAEEVNRYSNLLVFRTMSKAFALAGARVGYAMGHPSLIDKFDGLRPPGSIATPSADLAEAALGRVDRAEHVAAALAEGRRSLAGSLTDLGFRVLDSRVNFLLCEVGSHAKETAADLRGRGLVVRTFPDETGLSDYLRFTVRSEEQNNRLTTTLKEVLP